jgi:hypothetical protein
LLERAFSHLPFPQPGSEIHDVRGCDALVLLRRALEQRLEDKGQSWEWAEILRGLDNLQEVEALFQGKRFVLRSQVLGQAHKAFQAAGVALPPTLREKT